MANRRNTELGLMMMVVIITAGAYMLAGLGSEAQMPANIIPFLVIVLGLLLGAHVAVRRLAPEADPILLPLAALLNGLGYVVIAGLNEQPGVPSGEALARQQAVWTAVGIAAFIVTLLFVKRPRELQRYRYTFVLVGIGLLLLPFIPGIGIEQREPDLGDDRAGQLPARRGRQGRPGHLLRRLPGRPARAHRHQHSPVGPFTMPDPKYLGPVIVAWVIPLVVMMAQKDLGTSLLFFALFVVMLWVATGRPSWLVVGGGLFVAGAWFAVEGLRPRAGARLDLARPLDATRAATATRSCRACSPWRRVALTGTGLGLRQRPHPASRERLHLRVDRRAARACSAAPS